jgi:hypothetical protein
MKTTKKKVRHNSSLSTRLNSDLERELKEEAEKKGITVSALINNVLSRYMLWDRMFERFSLVTLDISSFRYILDSMSVETAANCGRLTGERIKGFVQFRHQAISIQNFLDWLDQSSKYLGIKQFEVLEKPSAEQEFQDSELRTGTMNDGHHSIALYHDLGIKWSIYNKKRIEAAMNSIFPDVSPKFEVGENFLKFSFFAYSQDSGLRRKSSFSRNQSKQDLHDKPVQQHASPDKI